MVVRINLILPLIVGVVAGDHLIIHCFLHHHHLVDTLSTSFNILILGSSFSDGVEGHSSVKFQVFTSNQRILYMELIKKIKRPHLRRFLTEAVGHFAERKG